MKRIIALLCLAAMAATAFATVKINDNLSMGMKLRTRAWMTNEGTYAGSTNADNQIMTRKVDYRFRPWIDYKVNDMLSARAYFEVGDIAYGDDGKGAGIDADGKGIIEVKQLYADVQPSKEHMFRLGIQYWEDGFGMQFGNEAAGIMYYGNFGQATLDLGWFVPDDNGETNIDDETVSRGDNLIIAAVNYKMNKEMSFGLDNMLAMRRAELNDNYDETSTSFWFAPKFSGNFGPLSLSTKFAFYSMSGSFEEIADGGTEPEEPEASGWALSIKGGYDISKQMGVNFDLLYSPGDDKGVDYYRAYDVPGQGWNTNWYCNGTEIMTPGTIDKNSYTLFAGPNGIMMPAAQFWFKMNKTTKLLGTFAMANYTEEVSDETSYGMEFDVKAEISLYDKLEVKPFVAFFMPGDAWGDDTDMQTKVGVYTRIKL